MSGGFGVQEEAIQTAIGHLQDLLTQAQSDGQQLQQLQHVVQPGTAPETAAFHQRLVKTSAPDLITAHQAFVSSVQGQIAKLQTTLQRYQAGEDAAKYGFGN